MDFSTNRPLNTRGIVDVVEAIYDASDAREVAGIIQDVYIHGFNRGCYMDGSSSRYTEHNRLQTSVLLDVLFDTKADS